MIRALSQSVSEVSGLKLKTHFKLLSIKERGKLREDKMVLSLFVCLLVCLSVFLTVRYWNMAKAHDTMTPNTHNYSYHSWTPKANTVCQQIASRPARWYNTETLSSLLDKWHTQICKSFYINIQHRRHCDKLYIYLEHIQHTNILH